MNASAIFETASIYQIAEYNFYGDQWLNVGDVYGDLNGVYRP